MHATATATAPPFNPLEHSADLHTLFAYLSDFTDPKRQNAILQYLVQSLEGYADSRLEIKDAAENFGLIGRFFECLNENADLIEKTIDYLENQTN